MITMHIYPYDFFEGHVFLRIHASSSSKEAALKAFLSRHGAKTVIARV
jgi:hypothetical protein